ncbi:hypothetical protein DEO72_LG6g469 [Vigna unguiculata]|uniref:Uncharacterized protein n=1 Tax=Vigna unguiculata TaxID=3917 RepID=A0A4D6M4S4_VIGUN|nr:hypothetical protein DEO72_LG6g469 [Vigna unguiculata]
MGVVKPDNTHCPSRLDDQDVLGWPNNPNGPDWSYDINGSSGSDDPNRIDDPDEPGGLEDRDRLNRPDNHYGLVNLMAQAGRASPTTHTGLAGQMT